MAEPLAGTRVLAVDDDADALELIVGILERRGAVVSTATSAHEALELLGRPPLVDVMVCDVAMPSMDGNTFIALLRRSPRFAQLPALAYTAQVAPSERAASLAAGFTEHLAKVASAEVLASTVERLRDGGRREASSPDDERQASEPHAV